MAIHFVYSCLPGLGLAAKFKGRAVRLAQKAGWNFSYVGNRRQVDTGSWPSRAPLSITHHVYQALSARAETFLYDWQERLTIPGGPEDILIGHPDPGDQDTVFWRSLRAGRFRLKLALAPLVHAMPENCGRYEPMISQVDAFLGIMGPYWRETWPQSVFAHWLPKIRALDMAIDSSRYPRVKKRFNPPGKRKFFYIGWNGVPKGTALLSGLFGLAKTQACLWIGRGKDLANLEHRGEMEFTPQTMESLAEECDVLITMGVADSNPTTILESLAWGFPVACTPQSGYWHMPQIKEMSTTDMNANLKVLDYFQNVPESELLAQADAGRRLVESQYTWNRFLGSLNQALDNPGKNKGV